MARTRKLLAGPLALAGAFGVLMLPGGAKLQGYGPTTLEGGITTVDDAVEACRASGLEGWDLVTFAQRLVNRKFAHYATRNLWDGPARAFEHGMGYCTQYNLALRQILTRLGFAVRAVFCLRVEVADDPGWAMGHTWLRVTIGEDTREVCAGDPENLPGQVRFRPLLPVWPGNDLVFFLSHLGVILVAGAAEWAALLGRRGDPAWTFRAQAVVSIEDEPLWDLVGLGESGLGDLALAHDRYLADT